MKNERRFSTLEKPLIAASLLLGNILYKREVKKFPDRFFTVKQLCEAAGLELDKLMPSVQDLFDRKVSQVCRAGSRFTKDCICALFYNDGKEMANWAMANGALLCVTKYPIDDYPCIVVDEPATVYAHMCKMFRERTTADVTAIVGSIGKTTAKKMIYEVYKRERRTYCDAGNDNQVEGVGYICQHVPKKCRLWVQEVSEDQAGGVRRMSEILKPKIAVITAIDKSHIAEFGSEQGILDEIHSITSHMPDDGVCIVDIDSVNTASLIDDRQVITVSLSNTEADFYAKDIYVDADGLNFTVLERKTNKSFNLQLKNVYAEHNVYSALFAFAAGVCSGVEYDNIIAGISAYKATGVRQNVYKTKGITVYADCYNAVAKSVKTAVSASEKIDVSGRRIAVLGDIAETGDYAEETHNELVNIVNDSNFDVLYAYGNQLCKAVKRSVLRDTLTVVTCSTHGELIKLLRKDSKKGDLVLFKASHSSGLEYVLKKTFPFSYYSKAFEYYLPQIVWRIKMIFY